VPAQTQQTHVQRLSHENKGISLYIPLQAGKFQFLKIIYCASRLQKQKARSNPYMVIFNFIGYFILVLHDFPIPGAT
jgi:hypothetical protein